MNDRTPEEIGEEYLAARATGATVEEAVTGGCCGPSGSCPCSSDADIELLHVQDADASHADVVNHPPHYTFGQFEVIDVIEDWELDFHLANVVKYVARFDKKGDPLENLKKARFYLDRKIANLGG